MTRDFKTAERDIPSRRPLLGSSPIEGDEFFERLMRSTYTIAEKMQKEENYNRVASRYRDYEGYCDGDAD